MVITDDAMRREKKNRRRALLGRAELRKEELKSFWRSGEPIARIFIVRGRQVILALGLPRTIRTWGWERLNNIQAVAREKVTYDPGTRF